MTTWSVNQLGLTPFWSYFSYMTACQRDEERMIKVLAKRNIIISCIGIQIAWRSTMWYFRGMRTTNKTYESVLYELTKIVSVWSVWNKTISVLLCVRLIFWLFMIIRPMHVDTFLQLHTVIDDKLSVWSFNDEITVSAARQYEYTYLFVLLQM